MSNKHTFKMAPFLKWAGGKRALLRHIFPLIPETFNRYYEPFAGGAALFFALGPSDAILADRNDELINCYTQVRDNPRLVLRSLRQFANNKAAYYRIRSNRPSSKVGKAARLIYLTTLSFNGIYRLNLS